MRSKLFVFWVAAALLAVTFIAAPTSHVAHASTSGVVISGAYGGGGNSGAIYTHDFIELFNAGTSAVSLNGWSVQYINGTGTFNQTTNLPNFSLAVGQYYLIQHVVGAGGTQPLPTPDLTDTAAMAAANFRVVIANTTSPVTAVNDAHVVDYVGVGTATAYEGSAAAPAASNTLGVFRKNGGCTDTDNNVSDFEALDAYTRGARNTAYTAAPCVPLVDTPDLITTISATPLQVEPGDSVVFTATLENSSATVAASSIAFTVDFTGAFGSVTSVTQPATDCTVTAPVTCSIASLATNGTYEIQINVTSGASAGLLTASTDASIATENNTSNNANNIDVTVGDLCAAATPTLIGSLPANATTPITNVTIMGVVTIDAQLPLPNGLNPAGFYIQDSGDGNANTSDGIYVVLAASVLDVEVGDTLLITGTVSEANGQTRITPAAAANVIDCNQTGTVTPVTVTLPVDNVSDWERYEGMLVTVEADSGPLTVTEAYRLHYLGEYLVSSGGRLYTPTNIVEPGAPATAYAAENARRQLVIDDGRDNNINTNCQIPNMGCPDPMNPYDHDVAPFRMGSTTPELTGVLGYGFNAYRLHTTEQAVFTNVRPTSIPNVGGTLKVASFNVLNFFNGNGNGGGFTTSDQRGPNTPVEYDRMVAKLVIALAKLDADIIGLMEIENDGDEGALSAIADLTEALNNYPGTQGTYNYVQTGVIGSDVIAVALLYRTDTVTLDGAHAVDNNAINNRPTLAQTFTETASGESLTVVVNHFKSKSCTNATGGNLDQNDGQACYNPTRIAQATRLMQWLDTNPTGTTSDHVLIIGDLNSQAKEDPIDIIIGEGYTNMVSQFGGEFAYGYVFSASSGYLDHALANDTLAPFITGTEAWHINADEPAGRDYNDEIVTSGGNSDYYQPGELYQVNEFRTSDHDPVLIGISLSAVPGTTGTIVSSPETIVSGATVTVTVNDADLSGASINVTAVSTGESEELELALVSAGIYEGTFTVVNAAPTPANDVLEVPSGVITFTYVDALDASSNVNSNRTDTTTVTAVVVTGADGLVTAAASIAPGEDNYTITVTDADLSGASITVTLTGTNSESETLTLNEVVGTPGEYSATFDTVNAVAVASNGVVEAQNGTTLTITYTDALDSQGGNVLRTAETTVVPANTPSAFTLTSPIDVVLRDGATVSFTWQSAGDDNSYQLLVWHLSNNTRLGQIIDGVYEANDICVNGVCTVLSTVQLAQGTFGWTVLADGVAEVEASNAVGLFTVQYDGIELVSNGGFENGITDWTGKVSAKVKCGNLGANGSDCSLNVKPGGSLKQNGIMAGILSTTTTAGGDKLRISAQIWANKATWPGAIVVKVVYASPTAGAGGNGKDKFKLPVSGVTTTFAEYSAQYEIVDAIVNGSVKLSYKGATGKARFDDISVKLMPVNTFPRVERGADQNGVLPPPVAPSGFNSNN